MAYYVGSKQHYNVIFKLYGRILELKILCLLEHGDVGKMEPL